MFLPAFTILRRIGINCILIFTFNPGVNTDSIKLFDNAYVEISKLPGIKSYKMGADEGRRVEVPMLNYSDSIISIPFSSIVKYTSDRFADYQIQDQL